MRSLPVVLIGLLLACLSSLSEAADVRLSWSHSTSPDVINYRVYAGVSAGQYTGYTDVGYVSEVTLNTFEPGQTYYFAVTAWNQLHESAYSNEVSTTIPGDAPTDITAPTVSIIAPADGSTVARKSMVTVEVTASDNVGVIRVEVWVNGLVLCALEAPPYTCPWKVPAAGNGRSYLLEALAADAAGHMGISPPVTVSSR